MKIGFIGAGKVGCTLGRHFVMHGHSVIGYYDIDKEAVEEAAKLTRTTVTRDLESIVSASDILFITVNDSMIESVWNQIRGYNLTDMIICHCSGSLSSDIFSDIAMTGACGYSVHPLFACSSKENSYKDISKAIFTVEGSKKRINEVVDLIESTGNKVQKLNKEKKALYHCAAAVVSNQVLGIIKMGTDMLIQCGFSEEDATNALMPLITGNINNLEKQGLYGALTGPVERNDIITIKKHLDAITEEDAIIYKNVSKKLVDIAKVKNKDRDYTDMLELLSK
ncbi:MAG: DUF2520 domain-containing protein [Lachnospiraceae bacterium]|nr:DUF2520 domain-containing protein [Lachnospiraceae bacterium]